jgi:hypothetical protein
MGLNEHLLSTRSEIAEVTNRDHLPFDDDLMIECQEAVLPCANSAGPWRVAEGCATHNCTPWIGPLWMPRVSSECDTPWPDHAPLPPRQHTPYREGANGGQMWR